MTRPWGGGGRSIRWPARCQSWTAYNYSFNNPIRFNDPLGDRPSATFNINQTNDNIGQDQSKDWFGEQGAMNSNGGGGGIQKYLPSSPPTAKEGQKQEEKRGKVDQNPSKNENYQFSGEVSLGAQAGFNLNNIIKADLTLASTPIVSFQKVRINSSDSPFKYKNALTINRSAGVSAFGFGIEAYDSFLGNLKGGGYSNHSYGGTAYGPPIYFPFLTNFAEISSSNQSSFNPQQGAVFKMSISFIIKFEITYKTCFTQ